MRAPSVPVEEFSTWLESFNEWYDWNGLVSVLKKAKILSVIIEGPEHVQLLHGFWGRTVTPEEHALVLCHWFCEKHWVSYGGSAKLLRSLRNVLVVSVELRNDPSALWPLMTPHPAPLCIYVFIVRLCPDAIALAQTCNPFADLRFGLQALLHIYVYEFYYRRTTQVRVND